MMINLTEVFATLRRPDDPGDSEPVGPIRIDSANDVAQAVAEAKRRKRRAPVYPPESLAAFDSSAPEVEQ